MRDRWARVGALFDRAIAAAPGERGLVLDTSDEPDDVKAEVRSLLDAHEAAGDFLETPPVVDLLPGAEVGPYRIGQVLGRGGMGVVYEAFDARLGRRVALKALPPELAADDTRRRRLKREARAAAALQHPGIATVYALEEIDGDVFIATEYLVGETLRAVLERGPLDAATALDVAATITQALCAAHDRGVVHRDLKPENIMRTTDGTLKVLDFGVAQIEQEGPDALSRSLLTAQGLVVGTPAYMAPEQLLGLRTDARTDQFALGVIIYELITGIHPFGAGSIPSTVSRILSAPPQPPVPAGSIPPAVWAIVERCLAKDPAERFASTADLLAALQAARSTLTSWSGAASAPVRSGSTPEWHTSAVSSSSDGSSDGQALRWWRFHQFAAAAVYAFMVWPAWHVHAALGRIGLWFFFATLAAVVVAATLRLHLWFSSRVYPATLARHRHDVSRWIRAADIAFATLLVVAGIALPPSLAGWAALLISVGIGAAVAFLVIEPATARAALSDL